VEVDGPAEIVQLYAVIPDEPKRLVVSPKKMVVVRAEMAVVGRGLTESVKVMTESQPLADVIVRV
jgi:hypothetical protein